MLKGLRFRPTWTVSLAAVVVFVILAGLGVWQLQREKQSIQTRDHYRARSRMPAIDVNTSALDPANDEFRRARASGRYRGDLTMYLDNKVLNGVPGYYILTPLETAGGQATGAVDHSGGGRAGAESTAATRFILVNRGWVSWGRSRKTLPAVDPPRGPITVFGQLELPPKSYFTLEKHPPRVFKPRWENLDLSLYRKLTGLPVSPLVLRLAPGDKQGGGLVRPWKQYNDPWVARHEGYAIQWFSLAFILVVMYVGLNIEKKDSEHG